MPLISALMRRVHKPIYDERQRTLVRSIVPHLREGDAVLDVGCGFGGLGRAILDASDRPAAVTVRGLESYPRDGALIDVDAYEGERMPYDDDSFDVVIVADVLHHETDDDALLAECARVSRRYVIVKDHLIQGLFAKPRICFIDWAANAPYGVPCLFRYYRPAEWREIHRRHGFEITEERSRMDLYPPGFNLLFGRGLHYFAVVSVEGAANAEEPSPPRANDP